MKTIKAEEIFFSTENQPGKLEEVSKAISEAGVNIRAINGYVVGKRAFFRIITSDNTKAREVLSSLGEVEIKEVVILELPDEIGKLHEVTLRLKEAGIDLTHIYGTTSSGATSCTLVFSSNDNTKATEVLAG